MDNASAVTSLLRHGPFVRFLYVRVAASVALQLQALAVGWQMYVLTGSSFNLGLVGLVQFIPTLGLFLVTGHVADRFDRRVVAASAQSLEALAIAVLAVTTAVGLLTPGLLLGMAFVIGAGRAFEQPSLQSVLPNIVPAQALPRAIAAANSAAQTAVVAGPALGGLLLAVSPALTFAVCALLWLTAAAVMLGVAVTQAFAEREPLDLKTLFSGFVFIGRNKAVLGAITLDLFAVLLGSTTALLPVFASDIFPTGPLGFGALRAAPAVGAIVAALILTRRPIARRIGHAMFGSVAVYGAATVLFALSPNFVIATLALAVVGAADLVSVVIRQSLVQLYTPDEMRGRVFAVNSMFTATSNQLGTFRAGTAAALLGTVPAVMLGGLSTIAVVLIAAAVFRDLFRADRYEPTKV
ncbi:MAG TPA: MFS transporter [Xanthobacteraceae bacterium]|nr:MFS transporter [Xanthobacteraceae bacterium]